MSPETKAFNDLFDQMEKDYLANYEERKELRLQLEQKFDKLTLSEKAMEYQNAMVLLQKQ